MELNIINLTKSYDNNIVLDNINYKFKDNKIYSILGRNGIGKTTLFNCLSNDIESDYKEILFNNKELDDNDISYVKQDISLPDFLTINEFIKTYTDINNVDLKLLDKYIKLLEINDKDKLIKDLSIGNKTKLYMLISFLEDKKIILLDEPLVNLDIIVQNNIVKELKKLSKNKIIIISTNILEIALDISDEIVLINNKKLNKIDKKNIDKNKIIKLLG